MSGTLVERSQLGPITLLDSGAVGAVHRLDRHRIPGLGPLAFKEYLAAPAPDEVANLYELVRFRRALSRSDRQLLDGCAAWPLEVVVDRGQVCGLLMLLIPDEFFSRQRVPSGKVVTVTTKAQWLVVDSARAVRDGIRVPDNADLPSRLVLCARLAHVFAILHRAGLTYGDLSLNNVVVSARMPPRMMLVDCDAIKTPAATTVQQLHTLGWRPPERTTGPGAGQDPVTDVYKLGLFILRCLTPGEFASQTTDPDRAFGILDARGLVMLRAALGSDRAARPTAREWYAYLVGFLAALTQPPAFEAIEVDEQVVLAGHPVIVRWRTSGTADVVVLTTADGHRQESRGRAAEGEFTVSPLRTGVIELRAHNPHGSGQGRSPIVHVMQLPQIRQVSLPAVPPPPTLSFGAERPFSAVTAALTTAGVNLDLTPYDPSVVPAFDPRWVTGDGDLRRELAAVTALAPLHLSGAQAVLDEVVAQGATALRSVRLHLAQPSGLEARQLRALAQTLVHPPSAPTDGGGSHDHDDSSP